MKSVYLKLSPVVVLFLSSIIWGLTWLPLKFIHSKGIDGLPLLLVSHAALGVLMLFAQPSLREFKKNLRPLLGIALAGGGAIICFTYALMYGDVIRVMVLFYLLPVWGVLGGWLLLGEPADGLRWIGVVMALLGAYLILGGSQILIEPPSFIDLLALLSGMAFAINNLLFRAVERVGLVIKLSAMFWGCALLAATLLIAGVQSIPITLGYEPWLWVLLYSVTAMLLANLGSQWSVTQMESGKSSVILIMELVAAVVSALLIAGERLEPLEWLGCFLIVAAALLEARRPIGA